MQRRSGGSRTWKRLPGIAGAEHRKAPPRPAGEGVHAIARHHKHYAPRVSPRAPVVAVRNPRTDSAAGLDPARRATLPRPFLAELGIELEPQHEDLATARIFTDLQLEQSVHPLEPLVKGEWA